MGGLDTFEMNRTVLQEGWSVPKPSMYLCTDFWAWLWMLIYQHKFAERTCGLPDLHR